MDTVITYEQDYGARTSHEIGTHRGSLKVYARKGIKGAQLGQSLSMKS
jgi:hypothetical protein